MHANSEFFSSASKSGEVQAQGCRKLSAHSKQSKGKIAYHGHGRDVLHNALHAVAPE